MIFSCVILRFAPLLGEYFILFFLFLRFVVADYFAHFVFFRVLALHCCIVSHMYSHVWGVGTSYLGTPYTHTIPLYDL